MSTTRRASHRFHATQEAYFAARALVETIREACAAEDARQGLTWREGMSIEEEAALDLAYDTIRTERGYYAARVLMQEAEVAMVDWSIEHARGYSPSRADMLADLRQRARKSAVHWPKLVDIATRLAA